MLISARPKVKIGLKNKNNKALILLCVCYCHAHGLDSRLSVNMLLEGQLFVLYCQNMKPALCLRFYQCPHNGSFSFHLPQQYLETHQNIC